MNIEQRLEALDTSALSDALDRTNVVGQALGILPIDRSFRVIGRAFTVRMLPTGESGRSVGDYIDDVPSGAVVVIDNGGRSMRRCGVTSSRPPRTATASRGL